MNIKNLTIRTLTGLAYLAVMVGCLLFSKYAFLALMLVVLTLMMNEFHKMNMGEAYPGAQLLATITGQVIFVLFFLHYAFMMDVKFMMLAFVPVLVQLIYLLSIKDRTQLDKIGYSFASVLYVAVPLALFVPLVFFNYSFRGDILLCFFSLVWMSDVGAYVFGMLLGQKYGPKLCPTISPKKSWIGAIGGFAVALGWGAALYGFNFLPYNIWHCLGLAAVINVTGVLGDLIESVWKRHCGVKDSGNILPGHGGMMDRFDSAMIAIPSALVYLIIFGLI